MNPNRSVAAAVALAFTASLAHAQSLPPTALTAAITPIHTAADDGGLAYGIWGAAYAYKVSFHDGMTFVPYLGDDYPHNQPFGWRTRSVTVGGVELATAPPIPARIDDTRYEYRLGGVTEAYEVRSDGLFQTFVIGERPPGRGELVVCGELRTALVADPVAAGHQDVTFFDAAGTAILGYGAATAVDAAGNRRAMTTEYRDGNLTLRLDAAWLETAVFPLTVDPLVAVLLSGGGGAPSSVDICRDGESASLGVWYTYSRAASSTDRDLWILRTGDRWMPASTMVFSDITTAWDADSGKIATSAGTDKVVTLFRRYFDGLAPRFSRIRWHTHRMAFTGFDSSFGLLTFDSNSGINDWRPAIGGTAALSSGTAVCFVWQREHNGSGANFSNGSASQVWGAILDVAAGAQGTLGTPFPIRDSQLSDSERPRLNRVSAGDTGPDGWCMVSMSWNRLSATDWDACLTWIGNDGSTGFGDCIEPTDTIHKLGPTIAGRGNRYLVQYATAPTTLAPGKVDSVKGQRIKTARVELDDHGLPRVVGTKEIHATNHLFLVPGNTAYDASTMSHWAITYSSVSTAHYYITICGYQGALVDREVAFFQGVLLSPGVGGITFDPAHAEFVLAYPVGGTHEDVIGSIYAYPTAVPWRTSGTGCSSAGLSWNGFGEPAQQQLIGNEFTSVLVTGTASNSLHALAVALTPADTALTLPGFASGCRALIPLQAPIVVGLRLGANCEWRVSLPEGLDPCTLHFQDFHTDANGRFLATQRLEVPVVR
ncbi:MAG: hypothetical protein KDE27_05755 [Planctomycetes bacterium]|nr:hypothetical protein [Planctomycetota bacterium]